MSGGMDKKDLGSVMVLSLNYPTIGTVNGNEINREINAIIATGKNKLVLDLKDVQNANSFGLSLFFRIKNKLKESSGDLAIINICEHVSNLLKTAGLYEYFEICQTEDEAVKYLEAK
jgi:anti-anti-sigma factor